MVFVLGEQTSGIETRSLRTGIRKIQDVDSELEIQALIKVIEENPDWNRCIDEKSIKLGRCVHACDNNQECENDCLSRFKTTQLNCPCEVCMFLNEIILL